MTREERENAIDIIQSILDKYEEDECLATEITIGDEDIKAFKMAIKALEQEPRKGHWIETAEEYYKAINEKGGGVNESTDYFTDDIACSECLAKFSVIENEADRFDFCPCCGSDNR